MKPIRLFAAAAILAGLAAAGVARADNEVQTNAAQTQAEAWLKAVDGGDYDASWTEAATLFQKAIAKEQWREAVSKSRQPFGKLISRKVKSRQYTETLPGAPDGKYVVLTYDSVFENKKAAVETITPMLDGARGWRVSGYFIK
jgi:Protein of unknown function (DUF4019)